MRQSWLLTIAVLGVASVALIVWSSTIEAPFVVLFLVVSAWAITVAVLSRPEAIRNGALICGSVLFSLGIVETYMYFANRSKIIITRTEPVEWRRNQTDIDIGSRPVPNTTITFEEALGGRRIDKVTYRFGSSGHSCTSSRCTLQSSILWLFLYVWSWSRGRSDASVLLCARSKRHLQRVQFRGRRLG